MREFLQTKKVVKFNYLDLLMFFFTVTTIKVAAHNFESRKRKSYVLFNV